MRDWRCRLAPSMRSRMANTLLLCVHMYSLCTVFNPALSVFDPPMVLSHQHDLRLADKDNSFCTIYPMVLLILDLSVSRVLNSALRLIAALVVRIRFTRLAVTTNPILMYPWSTVTPDSELILVAIYLDHNILCNYNISTEYDFASASLSLMVPIVVQSNPVT